MTVNASPSCPSCGSTLINGTCPSCWQKPSAAPPAHPADEH